MTQSSDKIFYLAAAMIIDPHNRLLVVRKRETHKYMLPGGKIEAGERPIETLIREIKEEVALTIDPASAQFIDCYHAPAANEPGYQIESNLFRIDLPQSLTITPAAEIAEACWVDYATAKTLDLAPMMASYVLPLWQGESPQPNNIR